MSVLGGLHWAEGRTKACIWAECSELFYSPPTATCDPGGIDLISPGKQLAFVNLFHLKKTLNIGFECFCLPSVLPPCAPHASYRPARRRRPRRTYPRVPPPTLSLTKNPFHFPLPDIHIKHLLKKYSL